MSKANGYWYTTDYRVRFKKKRMFSTVRMHRTIKGYMIDLRLKGWVGGTRDDDGSPPVAPR
jgi:3'-phosphoadenosine 5'-phosphosulfate sulfotransferase (PAPS reductase)/FAD synthetase